MQELWDTYDRPQYLTGVLRGANQARNENRTHISVVEFGVASGQGLLNLQAVSQAVEAETGISIHVYGFDLGTGLGTPQGGYRDHPDRWQEGDFPMPDFDALRSKFSEKTSLILGDVSETVDDFVDNVQEHPIGFIAFDLDYHSSTVSALKLIGKNNRNTLIHVPLYFDDTLFYGASDYAGERLAITEFNERDFGVKISEWHVLKHNRPFPERQWLSAMYTATDFDQLKNHKKMVRPATVLPM